MENTEKAKFFYSVQLFCNKCKIRNSAEQNGNRKKKNLQFEFFRSGKIEKKEIALIKSVAGFKCKPNKIELINFRLK